MRKYKTNGSAHNVLFTILSSIPAHLSIYRYDSWMKFHNDSLIQLLKPHKLQTQLYIHILEDKATWFLNLRQSKPEKTGHLRL